MNGINYARAFLLLGYGLRWSVGL